MSSIDVRAISVTELKNEAAPLIEHEFRVMIKESAFDRAVERGGADLSREIGGVLVGQLLRDTSGPYLVVEETIDALHADEKGAELTFTHATWEHINKEMDKRHAGKKIVGWYHTHPGFGIFLSDRDQFIHKSFFNLPFQIALVYDPKSREHGVFQWTDGEPMRSRRYWVGKREHAFDGPRRGESGGKKPAAIDANQAQLSASMQPARELADEKMPSWMWLAATGLIGLIAGGTAAVLFMMSTVDAAITKANEEISRAQVETYRGALSTLNYDLVDMLRATISDGAVRGPLSEITRDLTEVSLLLDPEPSPTVGEAARRVRLARDRAREIQVGHEKAHVALAEVQRMIQRRPMPPDLSREVANLKTAVGAMYAEMAVETAKAGDPKRAARFLATAAVVDPANQPRYEQQVRAFVTGSSTTSEGKKP